jgi:hypothetical protein
MGKPIRQAGLTLLLSLLASTQPAFANTLICRMAMSPTHGAPGAQSATDALSPTLKIRLQMQVKTAKEMLTSNSLHVVEVGQFLIQHAAAAVDRANTFLQTDPALKRDFGSGWSGDELGAVNTRLSSTFQDISSTIKDTKQKYGMILKRSKTDVLKSLLGQQRADLGSTRDLIMAVNAEIDELRLLDSKFAKQQSALDQEVNYLLALQEALRNEAIAPATSAPVTKMIQSNLIPSTVAVLENLRSLQGLMSSTRISLGNRAKADASAIDLARLNNTAWSSLLTTASPELGEALKNSGSPEKQKAALDQRTNEIALKIKTENDAREIALQAEFCIQRDLCSSDLGYILVPAQNGDPAKIEFGSIGGIDEKGLFSFNLKSDQTKISDLRRGDIAITDRGAGYNGYQVGDRVMDREFQYATIEALFPDQRAVLKYRYDRKSSSQNGHGMEEILRILPTSQLATLKEEIVKSETGRSTLATEELPDRMHIKINGVFVDTKEALVRFRDRPGFRTVPISDIHVGGQGSSTPAE